MNDNDLRKQFEELRGDDARVVPRFHIPRGRRAPRPRLLAASAMILILSAVLLAAIGIRARSTTFSESDRMVVQSVAAWRAPTRFLLRTPGEEFLTTTPLIPDVSSVLLSSKGVSR
jgi:hypothetical protein